MTTYLVTWSAKVEASIPEIAADYTRLKMSEVISTVVFDLDLEIVSAFIQTPSQKEK